MSIVLLIFLYIVIDVVKTKPEIKRDIIEVKKEYLELSGFLDTKIPEIDSTLRIQSEQISKQSEDINSLNSKVKTITKE
jgi:cob(I)alamin adenosyltransferase